MSQLPISMTLRGALLPGGSRLAALRVRRFTALLPEVRTAPAGFSSLPICHSATAARRFGHGSIFASVCNIRTGPNSTGPPRISTAWGETRATTIRSSHTSGLCSNATVSLSCHSAERVSAPMPKVFIHKVAGQTAQPLAAARQPRHDRADRNPQHARRFAIREILDGDQQQDRTLLRRKARKRAEEISIFEGGVLPAFNAGQFVLEDLGQCVVRAPPLPALLVAEQPII